MSIIQLRTKVIRDSIIRPANTTAYAAGDVISEVTTNDHYTFENPVLGGELSGYIEEAKMMINANQTTKPDLELWLFDTDIAEVADNSAFAPTDTEILTLLGIIDFGVDNWKVGLSGAGASGNIVQQVRNINLPIRATGNADRNIYGQLVVRNAYTPIDSEQFDVELAIAQN